MWINLRRLLMILRQRGIDFGDITVFVDDYVINPRYRRPLPDDSEFEEDGGMSEDEPDEH